ncbi:NAD(P)/FAD-dependent oxidoreductase [Cellulomonas carbonis]|uniref:FAD dependent oxidoreductase domain-containing protein n=1 Tax=Cellulomonas carbonis T26 TaxID=947969 RepID=A0A0A0BQP8_9CELL|nr:FAD-binding oxidoreductase [Cellulomonas carbonis]KGM09434.1 hypothetical protein N868_02205 [Cellulomonas carbonis T26]
MRLVVIGGGVVGMAVAEGARSRGLADGVVVLEQATLGSGASSYAGASDLALGWSDRHRRLVASSAAWHEAASPAVEYRRSTPTLWALEDPEDAGRLAELVDEDVEPAPAVGSLPAGARTPGHVIDPRGLVKHLRAELLAAGASEVAEGERVTAVRVVDGSVVVSTPRREIEADRVVVCVGPWVLETCRSWGLEPPPVRTKRVFGYRWRSRDRQPDLTFVDLQEGVFLFPRVSEPGVYAMSVKHDVWDVEPVEGPSHPTPDAVARRAAERVLGDAELVERKVFVDTYTADDQPWVAPLEATSRVWCVTGTHGSGVRLGVGLAHELLDLMWPAAGAATARVDAVRAG